MPPCESVCVHDCMQEGEVYEIRVDTRSAPQDAARRQLSAVGSALRSVRKISYVIVRVNFEESSIKAGVGS